MRFRAAYSESVIGESAKDDGDAHNRGPLRSTSLPQNGPVLYTPTMRGFNEKFLFVKA